MGCDILYNQGWSLPPSVCYQYKMQPLTVVAIVAFKHLMPFLSCEEIYCLLTAISSFLFLIGSIKFARHITGLEGHIILLAAILLPETYAIAMYPNSSILSSTCFIWVLVFITLRKYWLSIILMCIAPLFRLDVVIVYPAILPLFFIEGHSFKKSIGLSFLYAVLAVCLSSLGFYIFKADIFSTFSGYQSWSNKLGIFNTLIAVFGYYSLSYIILLPCGIYAIARKKKWKELALVLIPILILHFVYRSMGCASKHFLHITPFVIISGARALSLLIHALKENRFLKWATIVLVVLFYITSFRIIPSAKPWYEKHNIYNGGLLTSLSSTKLNSTKVTLGIGAGQVVPTDDEYTLASGQLFYSLYIHAYKNEIAETRHAIKSALDTLASSDIVASAWGTRAPFVSMYLSDKYTFHDGDSILSVKDDKRLLNFLFFDFHGGKIIGEESALSYLQSLNHFSERDIVYIIAGTPRYDYYLENLMEKGEVEKVSEMFYKYTFHEATTE